MTQSQAPGGPQDRLKSACPYLDEEGTMPMVSFLDALLYHARRRPGKVFIAPIKPCTTRRDPSIDCGAGRA